MDEYNQSIYNFQNGANTLGQGISGSIISGSSSNISIDLCYRVCPYCGAQYYSNTYHYCPQADSQKLQELGRKLREKFLYDTQLQGTTMTKETLLVVNDNGAIVGTTDKGLEDAKEKARSLTTKEQRRHFVLKPIWSCAPKQELAENDIV